MNTNEKLPIICGTDFSESATQAANAAAALASRAGLPLLLMHVADEFNSHAAKKGELARFLEPIRKQLQAEVDRLREKGAAVEGKLLHGTVAEKAILNWVKEHPATLVVVSSTGKNAVDRWTLGSVSERLAEAVETPTLVVRPGAPFEEWARGDRPLKVFVGADFTTNSDAALRWVAELRRIGPCEVVAAYADWPPKEASRLGVTESLRLVGNIPDIQRVLERDMREKVAGLLGGDDVRILVEGGWGRADTQLVGMAEEQRADLIVVGTHRRRGLGRLWHGSVSRGILHDAPMSVACVPTPAVGPMAGPRIRQCRRVLVAADLDSRHGFVAPYAYGMASPGGAVRLLHVIEPFRLPNPMIGGGYYRDLSTEEDRTKRVADAEARLRALAPEPAEAPGITTEVEVVEDPETAKAICEAAERFNADVVCIGGHTRPGFTAKVLGSVSQGVLQRSRRPVLVVWPPAE